MIWGRAAEPLVAPFMVVEINLNPAVERGAEAQLIQAYPKASTHPPGEPSFLCKPIQLKQLHSASTRNCRI